MRVIPDLVTTHRVIAAGSARTRGLGRVLGDVLRWLDELVEQTCAEPPVLVGKGLGGALAARYAVGAQRPDRRTLCSSTREGLERFRPPAGMALTFVGVLLRPTERGLERSFRRYCFVDLDRVRGEMGERYDGLVAYALDRFRTPSVKAAMRSLSKRLAPAIPEAELDRIAVPTTLIWGRHDVRCAAAHRPDGRRPPRLAAARDRGRARRPRRRAAGQRSWQRCGPARSLLPDRMTRRAHRDGDRRRRSGGPRHGLPPREARAPVRDPGGERTDRRLVAQAMGLASPIHARRATTGCRAALPRAGVVDSRQGRRRRLPGGLRGEVRARGPDRCARGRPLAGGRPLRGDGRGSPVRGRPRRRRVGRVPATPDARLRRRTRSGASCSCTPAQYRSRAQLQDGGVLVVGASNSGAEIALEVAGEHRPGCREGIRARSLSALEAAGIGSACRWSGGWRRRC